MAIFQININENLPPTAFAGQNVSITLTGGTTSGSNQISDSTASDPENNIVSTIWTQVSGPNTAIIVDNTIIQPTINNLIEGVYVFRLTATDGAGLTDSDDIQIEIIVENQNNPPVIDPIPDENLILQQIQPVELVLNNTGLLVFNFEVNVDITPIINDPENDPLTTNFNQTSGPSSSTINENLGTYNIEFEGKAEDLNGSYDYNVTTEDPSGLSDNETFNINVQPCEGFYNRLVYDFDETLFDSSIYSDLTGTLDIAVETSTNFHVFSIADVTSPFDLSDPNGTHAIFSTIGGEPFSYDPLYTGAGLSTDAYQDIAPIFISRNNGRVLVDFNYFTRCDQEYRTNNIYTLSSRILIKTSSTVTSTGTPIDIFINNKKLKEPGSLNQISNSNVGGDNYIQVNIGANGTGREFPMLYDDNTNFTHVDYLNLINTNGTTVIRIEPSI